jgi:hypothetical protein
MHASCNSYDPTVAGHFQTYKAREAPTWSHLLSIHAVSPFNLMHLGGDQLYMDFLAFQVRPVDLLLIRAQQALH